MNAKTGAAIKDAASVPPLLPLPDPPFVAFGAAVTNELLFPRMFLNISSESSGSSKIVYTPALLTV